MNKKEQEAYNEGFYQGKLKGKRDTEAMKEDADGCVGYVFIAMSGEHYIVSADYMHCDDIYEQLEEMEDDTENGFEPSVYVFHKDKVFLTKEEAEQALAKMKEGV